MVYRRKYKAVESQMPEEDKKFFAIGSFQDQVQALEAELEGTTNHFACSRISHDGLRPPICLREVMLAARVSFLPPSTPCL